jgi:hypothetical protein
VAQREWIQSNGGPLVMVPTRALSLWRGVFGSSQLLQEPSDYERACSVPSYLGVIPLSIDATAVILGDAPLMTTWVPLASGPCLGMLVRWVYAEDVAAVERAIGDLSALDKSVAEEAFIEAPAGDWTLLDAAEAGSDIRGESLTVHLAPAPGCRVVTSFVSGADLRLLVHQWRGIVKSCV